jgi:hypothetical protein
MTNRFGMPLHPDSLRWAAAEGVSEDVVTAVLLLHETSVDEVADKLSPRELAHVVRLVGRNPRLYPPGMLEDLRDKLPKLAETEEPSSGQEAHAVGHSAPIPGGDEHERRLAMLRTHRAE